jgi:hypothetical protein
MDDRCKKPNQLKKPPFKRNSSKVYNSSYKRLQQQLAVLLGEAEEAEKELARHTERQRCLLDLVLHQELVIELLHGDFTSVVAVQAGQDSSLSRAWAAAEAATAPALTVLQGCNHVEKCTAGSAMQPLQGGGMPSSAVQLKLTDSGTSSTPQQQQQLEQLAGEAHVPEAACPMITNSPAATAVGSSSSSGSCELIACSYTAELLRTATPADLISVANMTTQGWHEQFYALFLRLVVLLELVNRNSAEAAQDAAGSTAVGNAAAGTPVPDTAAAAAAGLSAAEPAAAAAASLEFIRQVVSSGPHGALAQVQATVDVHVRRVAIAYMFNHVPLLEACTADFATRQTSVPPPGHWQVSRS